MLHTNSELNKGKKEYKYDVNIIYRRINTLK